MKFQQNGTGPVIDIWLADLIYAMQGRGNEQGYINITTGNIIIDDNNEISPNENLVVVYKYVQQYHDMQVFIESLPSGNEKDELAHAIIGDGAFRRFKDLTRKNFVWQDFKKERQNKIAFRFLKEIGLERVD